MTSIDTAGPWVDVVFLDGDDYYGCTDEDMAYPDMSDMGIEDMIEYMSKWDYGDETDMAHTRDGAGWGSSDNVYVVQYGGLEYVVTENRAMGYASLNRRPLDYKG